MLLRSSCCAPVIADVSRQMTAPWLTYELAARKVLADLRQILGLKSIEGKQSLHGASGTDWEIDAKAWRKGNEGFVVVEVRRHTVQGLKQEELAAIAFRIADVGGVGGVVVSPLPMQSGALLVANSNNIAHVRVSPESTTEQYMAEFMGRVFFGASITESASATDSSSAVLGWATPNAV